MHRKRWSYYSFGSNGALGSDPIVFLEIMDHVQDCGHRGP